MFKIPDGNGLEITRKAGGENIDDIIKTWENTYNKDVSFNTCNCQEGKCFFAEHNDLIEQVISPCEHFKFV